MSDTPGNPLMLDLRLLAAENLELGRRVAELENERRQGAAARRAALNLMEDAVDSRRRAEALNAELIHEISERKRAEEALRSIDRRKNEFLAVLGHELRNPLAAIKGGVMLLNSGRARPESQAAALPIAARQIEHMERLLDDVLDLARIERGKFQIRPEPIRLQDVLQGALEMVRDLGKGSQTEIRCRVPEAAVTVQADYVRLTQVFVNLLTNALKFSPPEGEVRIEAAVAGPWAEVRVLDRGVGIQPELIPHIFEPFVQSSRSAEGPEFGLGLGLAVSRQLVELHGGTIEARSEGEDRGSEFIVRLPRVAPDAA